MALPTPVKSWQYNVGQNLPALGSALADNRRILRTIKNSLIGFGTQPWTVVGSSSSTAAGLDAVDRWAADSDLVWNAPASAHSWIVLKQTGIYTTFALLLSCEGSSSSGSILTIVVSPSAGFTGGSTTARPTATDEIVLINSASWGGAGTTDVGARLQVMQSTDGQITRVIVHVASTARTYWAFGKPANPISGWTNPSYAIALGSSSTGIITHANLYRATNTKGRANSTTVSFYMSGESFNDTLLGESLNFAGDISATYPVAPIGLVSLTATARDRYGVLTDVWWGSTGLSEGATYPNSSARTFVQFGVLIFPWDGSAPVVS